MPWNYKRKTTRKPYKKYGNVADHDLEAFEMWFNTRSYHTIQEKFNVTWHAIYKHAEKNEWLNRLIERIRKARERADDKLAERVARDAVRQYDVLSLAEVNAANLLKSPNLQAGQSLKAGDTLASVEAMDKIIKNKRILSEDPGKKGEGVEITFKDYVIKVHKDAGEA